MKRLLEIESKFRFRESLLPRFRANQGNPPFQRLAFIRTHKFEDIYYDRGDVLCKNGLWIRERIDHDSKSRTLESKSRLSGTYTHSTFSESTNPQTIQTRIQQYLPNARINIHQTPKSTPKPNSYSISGLEILAQLVTTRQVYLADEKFTLVLDETDFGHMVGEVELEVEEDQAEKAREEIDAFLEMYRWFCGGGDRDGEPVEGKLEAYFRRVRGG